MKKIFLLMLLFIPLYYSCDFLNPNNDDENDSRGVAVGRVLLNFMYNDVDWVFTYNDSSKIYGNTGGHNGIFDSNYGSAESKTESGVKVITANIDRVMPFGETVVADLKLTFNNDESKISKLELDKSEVKNSSEKWVLEIKDIVLFDEDDTKKVYKITTTDVCGNTLKNYYKLITDSYYKTFTNWDKCQAGDISHITIELFK